MLKRIIPNDTRHKFRKKQNYFWFDDNGVLYYGPDESNLRNLEWDEINGRFPLTVRDLENAFKLGAGMKIGELWNEAPQEDLAEMCVVCIARTEGRVCLGVEVGEHCLSGDGPVYKK